MTLSNIQKTAAAGLALASITTTAEAQDSPPEFHGLIRTAIENGRDQLPNVIVNTKTGGIRWSAAGDIYDPDGQGPQGHKARLFWLNATAKTPLKGVCDTATFGMQTAFFNTGIAQTFNKARPLLGLDSQLTVNGGITGLNCASNHALSDSSKITTQWYIGTKLAEINQDLGNEKGPGFGALVVGGGAKLNHKFDSKASLTTAYYFTHFDKGDAGVSRDQHYAYGILKAPVGENTQVTLYGEARRDTFTSASGSRTKLTTTFLGEVSGPIHQDISYRLGAGSVDGDATFDGAVTFPVAKQLNAQLGATYNANTNDAYTGFALAYKF